MPARRRAALWRGRATATDAARARGRGWAALRSPTRGGALERERIATVKRRRYGSRRVPADWSLRAALLVAVGGALGCVLRYFAGVWLTRSDYPWGTVFVNLLGSFVIAVFMFGAVARGWFGADARVFFVTGVLGGFTTMSSFAYETTAFLDDGEAARALGYAALTVAGSLAMALAGRAVANLLPGGA